MSISLTQCGALILAGGKSRRMGRCKASLPIGSSTILQHLAQELSLFPALYLSANTLDLYADFPGLVVKDQYLDHGPLAGIHAGLCATDKEYLFCIPCDMPYFTRTLTAPILTAFQDGMDALVCVDSQGNLQPLCGIYAKSALPAIEQALTAGNLRLKTLLSTLQCGFFSTKDYVKDTTFLNLNTLDDYAHFIKSGSDDPLGQYP